MTGKQYAKIVGIVAAFAIVLAVGYRMGADGAAAVADNPETGAYAPIAEAELAAFAIAYRQGNYSETARLGQRLFTEGRRIPDHAVRFAALDIGSPDPRYSNYQFHYDTGERSGKRQAIFLTVETATGRVDEFLAEESTIAK